MKKEWTDIRWDVHEAIRNARWFLSWVAEQLTDEIFADEMNRQGMASICGAEADLLDGLLDDYGLPAKNQTPWIGTPETEAEAIQEGRRKR